jgi:hypothetical protein
MSTRLASHHVDQNDATDDQCDLLGIPRNDFGGKSRTLTYCFLRLANLDNGVFERLGRYEAALWQQTVQMLFAYKRSGSDKKGAVSWLWPKKSIP